MSPRSSAAAPPTCLPLPPVCPPTPASDLSNPPHVYPPRPDPHQPEVPHSPGAPSAGSPRRSVPSGGSHTSVSPPPVPAFPSPSTPFLLASSPSPARRVPELHRLHGAAGSRPDPLTAPSSPGTSRIPPRRPSHTSAFRPYRKRRAGRERGGAARSGPGPRGVDPSHVVHRGADSELRSTGASSRGSPPQSSSGRRPCILRHCSPKTLGLETKNPSVPWARPLISQTEILRLLAKHRLDKNCGFLTSQVLCGRYSWFPTVPSWLNSCSRWRLERA